MALSKLTDLEGRLIKLENKTKENFFEVEKKFATLETAPGEVPKKLDERLHELEDLLLLLQMEYTKIKEKTAEPKAAPVIPANIERRLAMLESSAKEKPFTGMESRLTGMEERLKAGLGVPKDISDAMKTVDTQSKRILSLEELIEDLRDKLENAGRFSKKDVQEYIEKMNKARRDLGSEYERLSLMKDDFERISREREQLIENISAAEVNVEKADALLARMKAIEDKIDADVGRVEDMKSDVDTKIKNNIRELGFIRKEMESKLQTLEEKFKSRFDKLDSVRDSLDTKILSMEEKIDESDKLKKKVVDTSEIKKSLDEDIAKRISIEENLVDVDERILSIERDVAKVNTLKRGFDKEFAKMDTLEKRFDDVENKISEFERMATGSSELLSIKKELNGLKGKFASFESDTDMGKELGALQEYKKILEDEAAQRISFEKNIQDTNSRISSIENGLQEINLLKKALDNEVAQRISIEKSLQDIRTKADQPYLAVENKLEKELQSKLREFSAKIEDLRLKMELEGKELSKAMDLNEMKRVREEILEQKKTIHNLESRLESAAKKYFAENLEGFARALDKRIPGLISRDEYEVGIRDVTQKLQTIESPDLSPLSARVGFLEKRLNEIHEMMKDFSNRIPIVVE